VDSRQNQASYLFTHSQPQSGMAGIKPVHDKVNAIVEFFHKSTRAAEKLRLLQLQLSPDQQPLKLVNDVVTRWNSTHYMLQQILQVYICMISLL